MTRKLLMIFSVALIISEMISNIHNSKTILHTTFFVKVSSHKHPKNMSSCKASYFNLSKNHQVKPVSQKRIVLQAPTTGISPFFFAASHLLWKFRANETLPQSNLLGYIGLIG